MMVWVVALLGAVGSLQAYAGQAGRAGNAAGWPSALGPAPAAPTLLVAVHPRCPCTAATIDELAGVLGRVPSPPRVVALVFAPERSERWPETTRVTRRLRDELQAELVNDPRGDLAAAIGAFTSGHVVLFGSDGRPIFRGGVTPSRGHGGPNAGATALTDLLCGRAAATSSSAVFGCPIRGDDACGSTCPAPEPAGSQMKPPTPTLDHQE